jgi:carbamoyl-phosphate synthase large subunit
VKDDDKRGVIFIAKKLADMGFDIVATHGTYNVLKRNGVLRVSMIHKIAEGRPNILDLLKNREIALVINTPAGKDPRADDAKIRAETVVHGVPCITVLSAASAAVNGIEAMRRAGAQSWLGVRALQEHLAAVALATGDRGA